MGGEFVDISTEKIDYAIVRNKNKEEHSRHKKYPLI